MQFHTQHGAMLLKYSGISFISGAVNHGFFSGERSLWTAAIGIVLFVLGLWVELRQTPAEQRQESLGNTLLWGTLLSVGLGFFTGGLQHFPDSPERSSWVVPLGFAMSVVALLVQQRSRVTRATAGYIAGVGIAVLAGSVGALQWYVHHPAGDLAHGHGHGHGQAEVRNGPVAQVIGRSVEVRMSDAMRFLPGTIQVQAGEAVRIVARNDGRLPHELVIGTEEELRQHAEQMRQGKGGGHGHHGGAAVTVAPGESAELVVTYPRPQQLQIACLVPGHFEAGMRGHFEVVAQLISPATAAMPPATPAANPAPAPAPRSHGHDHRNHKH